MKESVCVAGGQDLYTLQAKENDGRGVQCARNIVLHLIRGEYQGALNARRLENDKLRNYPALIAWFKEYFGE